MSLPQQDTFRVVTDPEEIARHAAKAKTPLEHIYYGELQRVSMKWKHYLTGYDRYLSKYRGRKIKFLEIGIAHGGSFQVWREYFGKEATLFGIDINPESYERVKGLNLNCEARIGSQADPEFLKSVVREMGGLDIVIDDGSHVAEHQLISFRTLFPLLSNGGLYICEDLHTSYWADWNGGYKVKGAFIEVIKDVIDSIHAWYATFSNDMDDMQLHRHVPALHVHDSMVIIEKDDVEPPIMFVKK